MYKLLIIDDHPIVAEGIKNIAEQLGDVHFRQLPRAAPQTERLSQPHRLQRGAVGGCESRHDHVVFQQQGLLLSHRRDAEGRRADDHRHGAGILRQRLYLLQE